MNDKNLFDLDSVLKQANLVKEIVSTSSMEQKNQALKAAADSINDSRQDLKKQNDIDMEAATKKDLLDSFVDRLKLNDKDRSDFRFEKVIDLKDPVGQISNKSTSPSGFQVSKMRVPLGVIGVIYESRPNVTADASALCLNLAT